LGEYRVIVFVVSVGEDVCAHVPVAAEPLWTLAIAVTALVGRGHLVCACMSEKMLSKNKYRCRHKKRRDRHGLCSSTDAQDIVFSSIKSCSVIGDRQAEIYRPAERKAWCCQVAWQSSHLISVVLAASLSISTFHSTCAHGVRGAWIRRT
jgi:hypothetical protein